MDENELARRIMECKLEGVRNSGRPKLRLVDGTDENLSKLGIKGWWNVASYCCLIPKEAAVR